jgi:hypothetical protein
MRTPLPAGQSGPAPAYGIVAAHGADAIDDRPLEREYASHVGFGTTVEKRSVCRLRLASEMPPRRHRDKRKNRKHDELCLPWPDHRNRDDAHEQRG